MLKSKDCEYKEYASLERENSMHLPSVARLTVYPKDEEELIELVRLAENENIKYRVLGRMSNALIKNDYYDGIIIKTTKIDTKSLAENEVELSCGASLSGSIKELAALSLGGLEGLCGIPASVGGAVRQNAGAYGFSVSDRFISSRAFDTQDKRIKLLTLHDMCFKYRDSILSSGRYILLSARLALVPMESCEILLRIDGYMKRRRLSQPYELASLGSTFCRHNGIGAGYYIDEAGLKGLSVGGAEVSHKHANFIVNRGGATASDVISLMNTVSERVYEKFGIDLRPEIEIIE